MKNLLIAAALCLPGALLIFVIGCALYCPILGAVAAGFTALVAFIAILLVMGAGRLNRDDA